MNVFIIGNGRFGRFLYEKINSVGNKGYIGEKMEDFPNNICDIVILAVPIGAIENVLENFRPLFHRNVTLVDICSVKEHSIKVIEAAQLPCTCIHIHPLFGPHSSPDSCQGQKIVICGPTNDIFDELFFDNLEMCRVDATAEEHDKQMANSQVLTHVIGRAVRDTGYMKKTDFSTITHEKFMDVVETVCLISDELFLDMINYNRFAKDAVNRFLDSIFSIGNKLHKK